MHWLTVREIRERVASGELKLPELLQHLRSRIDSLDEQLHAFKVRPGNEEGIPVAIKDCFDVKGLPTTMGSRLMASEIATEDAYVVRRLREGGMIPFGKTHMVQFAFGGVGINQDDPTPLNPWVEEPHVAGGSSSGSAVAVATGMVPAALGSDTGGSIRIPAALCNIVGLKTTADSIDMSGVAPLSWSLDSIGILTRTVEDAAIVYDTITGAATHESLPTMLKDFRLAFAEEAFWEDIVPDVETAVRGTADAFKLLGAEVDSIPFEFAREAQLLNPNGLVASAEAYAVNRERLENHFDECDPYVAQRMLWGREVLAIDYLKAKQDWVGLRQRTNDFLQDFDGLLAPTTVIPAVPIAPLLKSIDEYVRVNRLYLRNTVIGNVLGLCALSVPCGFTSDGMPIGLMIYGKANNEKTILKIGHAFQQITDWHLKRPPAFP